MMKKGVWGVAPPPNGYFLWPPSQVVLPWLLGWWGDPPDSEGMKTACCCSTLRGQIKQMNSYWYSPPKSRLSSFSSRRPKFSQCSHFLVPMPHTLSSQCRGNSKFWVCSTTTHRFSLRRCVELDCWDGANDEPITQGPNGLHSTLTSLLLRQGLDQIPICQASKALSPITHLPKFGQQIDLRAKHSHKQSPFDAQDFNLKQNASSFLFLKRAFLISTIVALPFSIIFFQICWFGALSNAPQIKTWVLFWGPLLETCCVVHNFGFSLTYSGANKYFFVPKGTENFRSVAPYTMCNWYIFVLLVSKIFGSK